MHNEVNVKKKSTLISHCSEIVLSSVAVNLETSTEKTVASSKGRTQVPKIRH